MITNTPITINNAVVKEKPTNSFICFARSQTTSNIEKQKNALQLQISILKNKRVNRLKQKTFNVDKHRTITFTKKTCKNDSEEQQNSKTKIIRTNETQNQI